MAAETSSTHMCSHGHDILPERTTIAHREETVARIEALVERLVRDGRMANVDAAWNLLAAADRLTCAAMNMVAHMTCAQRFDPSGAPLAAEDFKPMPEGHTGGALNMVQAFIGYLLANALTATTRGWIMGQDHCVAGWRLLEIPDGHR